ncbi:hypothetical protein ACHWQZ_G013743 [Mnemiopsis leidyi]
MQNLIKGTSLNKAQAAINQHLPLPHAIELPLSYKRTFLGNQNPSALLDCYPEVMESVFYMCGHMFADRVIHLDGGLKEDRVPVMTRF